MSEQKREKFLSIKEAAAELEVHRNTVRNLIDNQKLEAEKKTEHKTVIKYSAVQKYKSQLQEQ